MRKKIVAGNWKMNKALQEGVELAKEITQLVEAERKDDTVVVMAPPFIHLSEIGNLVKGRQGIFLGAQNCNDHDSGAFTGETSVSMLKSVGAEYVILGHSERREYFNESNEFLAKKLDKVLENSLIPIFCCGEPLEIREKGTHIDYVKNQLTESLFHLNETDLKKVVIAYEPIWAIGTGKTASTEQAQEMHEKIRAHLASKYGDSLAQEIPILYGGSVKPSNSKELFAQEDVDGGLIGGASLKARDFVDIVRSFE